MATLPLTEGLCDRVAVAGQVRERMEHLPLAYYSVHQVAVPVELILQVEKTKEAERPSSSTTLLPGILRTES